MSKGRRPHLQNVSLIIAFYFEKFFIEIPIMNHFQPGRKTCQDGGLVSTGSVGSRWTMEMALLLKVHRWKLFLFKAVESESQVAKLSPSEEAGVAADFLLETPWKRRLVNVNALLVMAVSLFFWVFYR